MTRVNSHWRREQRREEALARQEQSNKRSPEEQLRRLDAMFGPGLGAQKERKKLAKKISGA